MLDEPRVSRVTKTSRNPANQVQTSVGGAQQQAARVGRQRAAVELRHNGPAFDPSKRAPFCATLCLHRAASPNQRKSFSKNNFCLIRRPDALPSLAARPLHGSAKLPVRETGGVVETGGVSRARRLGL